MTENERIKIVINFLKESKKIRNQQQFVEEIGSDKTIISRIINEKLKVSENLLKKIAETYPELNISWLLTGEGEMLKAGDNINIRQRDNNTNNIGNIHGIKDINDLKAKDDLIKHLQDEINYLRKQNETLMRMFEEK